MVATLIGLVYGTASLMARRIIVPDDIDGDAYLDQVQANLPAGMSLVKVARASLPQRNGAPVHDLDTMIAAIAAQGGPAIIKQPLCMVIDANNRCVDVIIADPALYQLPQAVTAPMTAAVSARTWDLFTPTPPFTLSHSPLSQNGDPVAAVGATFSAGVYTPPIPNPALQTGGPV